jgi:hypothetical protein
MSSSSKINPRVQVETGGIIDTARAEGAAGSSRWFTVSVPLGQHRSVVRIIAPEKKWSGTASVWLLCMQKSGGVRVSMTARLEFTLRPMPPSPMDAGGSERNIFVGEWKSSEM